MQVLMGEPRETVTSYKERWVCDSIAEPSD